MIDSALMRPAGIRPAVIAAACAAALGGCGGGGGSADDVAQSYVDARNGQDFQQVCELLSDQFREQLGGDNCARYIAEQSSGIPRRQIKVISVSATGDRATALLKTSGESGAPTNLKLSLARQDGDWRITSVGGAGPD